MRNQGKWLLGIVVVLILASGACGSPQQETLNRAPQATEVVGPTATPASQFADAAFLLPGMAAFAEKYPNDWEERLSPDTRLFVTWQRVVGSHALLVGISNRPEAITILTANWDGTDLFALGLPKTHDGKPIEVVYSREGPPKLLGSPP